jgi:uncharacterized SAM-binding protein YcdF (DUF218 family)
MSFWLGLLVLLTVGLILRRLLVGRIFAAAAALGMFLWSWEPFSAWFGRTLETGLPTQSVPAGDADAIVVLSGRFYPPDPAQPEVLPGYDTYLRCHHAAVLFRQWKAAPVLVTTGAVRSHGQVVDTAGAMKQALVRDGVPESMIWTENQSRSTYENALHSSALLREKGIRRIALVTEAYHMTRASRAFERQGISVLPAPCAFRMTRFEGKWNDMLTINPSNMIFNEEVFHEWLGLAWYRMSGKI